MDIRPGRGNGAPSDLTVFDGKIYFSARNGATGHEIWVTDGTIAGTELVADIWSGSEGSAPRDLTVVNNRLYFTADDGKHGRELWALKAEYDADINGDGQVAFADFLILSQHFGSVDVGLEQGDLDDDNEVTFADFLILADQFGRTLT
jgi:ELWxxDGT repeat protein